MNTDDPVGADWTLQNFQISFVTDEPPVLFHQTKFLLNAAIIKRIYQ